MTFTNYYRTLDVELNASAQEIKRSYRKLAHKYHPDISKLSNCEEIFKEISEAYTALRNSTKSPSSNSMEAQARNIKFETVNTFV